MFNTDFFHSLPVVGILRGFTADQVHKVASAAADGGLRNFEVTMNTVGAADLIRLLNEVVGVRANVGAGTVCSLSDLETALAAGAGFIVTPTVVADVIQECERRQIPVFPGAMSPAEIHQAFALGATMVKLFPAEVLGPNFIQILKGPFPSWRLMPTGGITVETLPAFARAGADAFGVGSPLFDKRRVEAQDWAWVKKQARRFVEAYAAR